MSKDYWFFLSYARNDAKGDPWLKEFYERLARGVSQAAALASGLEPEDIGFIDDRGIESGTQWTDELAEALQSSRVLVCLYSRSYFNSEWCGKEFQVFRDRVQAYVDAHPGLKWPPLIQPVLWDRPDKLPKPFPEIVNDLKLQYAESAYGQMYGEHGLEYIVKLGEKKEYERFLLEFPERVVNAARDHPLPRLEQLKPWEEVGNPFRQAPKVLPDLTPAGLLRASAPLPEAKGPEVAWFVYVAGRDQDYLGKREKRDSYGQIGGPLWKPYLPPNDKTAAFIAHSTAISKGMFGETLALSAQLAEHLRVARDTNTIVLLIVDPFSVELDAYWGPVAALNEYNFINCGVIILMNEKDPETLAKGEQLWDKIDKTFADTKVSNQLFFRESVKSDEFANALCAAIDEVRDKIMKRGRILRPVDSTGGSLPILNVPTRSPA